MDCGLPSLVHYCWCWASRGPAWLRLRLLAGAATWLWNCWHGRTDVNSST
jgi:hypothetical protein